MDRTFRPVRISILVAFAAAATWGWYVTHPNLWPEYHQATSLIAAIEQFKSTHGRLPIGVSELPATEFSQPSRVFYQPSGNGSYEVWFGRSLGESYTYDSSSRSWR